MSEGQLLSLVVRYPHPTALARQVRDGAIFAALRRLERRGLVRRRSGQYRLTRVGSNDLARAYALMRLMA